MFEFLTVLISSTAILVLPLEVILIVKEFIELWKI